MNRGKNICNELKAVRRRIAEENDIPLEIKECTYKGECQGTCPHCEAEMRYLERELAKRISVGKVATITGIALALSATSQAQCVKPNTTQQDCNTIDCNETCVSTLKGTVIDLKTGETLPFVNVILKKDNKQIGATTTDFDGLYTIKKVPCGDYTLEVSTLGYRHLMQSITVDRAGFTVRDIGLSADSNSTLIDGAIPVIDIGTPSNSVDEIVRQIGGKDGRVQAPVEAIGEIQVQLPGTPASQSGDTLTRATRIITVDPKNPLKE